LKLLYMMEFRYNNQPDDEPIIFSSLKELVTELIEWYQMVKYIHDKFMSTSRIVKLINPSSIQLYQAGKEIEVFRINSPYASESIVIYAEKS